MQRGSVTVKNVFICPAPRLFAPCINEGLIFLRLSEHIINAIGKKHNDCAIKSPGKPYKEMSSPSNV